MKTPVFTVTGVMACLMLLSQPVNAQITAGATFNLQAELKRATCNALTFSGDADSTGNVDFGTLSKAEVDVYSLDVKKKQVVLRLHCDSSLPPMVANVMVDATQGNYYSQIQDLKPVFLDGDDSFSPNFIWYKFVWGSEINQTVVKAPEGGFDSLAPGDAVDMTPLTIKRYSLVQETNKTDWDFPMEITRYVDTNETYPLPGNYSAAVTVNISYE